MTALHVDALMLTNRLGHRVSLTPLGAAMTGIFVPDRAGRSACVCVDAGGSAGKIIGRYANRIARGSFVLDGETIQLLTNEGPNTLHGGPDGFSKRTWEVAGRADASATFVLVSPDGDQGFPGTLECRVRYTWSDDDGLRIDYTASADKPTVANLTNHVYFNLSGDPTTSIAHYRLDLAASAYTPVDDRSIPTGEIAPVDPARDFRVARPVGTAAYDCNFVLDGYDGSLRYAGTLADPESGRTLVVETTQPGVQLFTGKPGAIALETQHFADAPNHWNFPSTALRPGETFTSSTVYRFGVR
jgi:aldose 1-epimerase